MCDSLLEMPSLPKAMKFNFQCTKFTNLSFWKKSRDCVDKIILTNFIYQRVSSVSRFIIIIVIIINLFFVDVKILSANKLIKVNFKI